MTTSFIRLGKLFVRTSLITQIEDIGLHYKVTWQITHTSSKVATESIMIDKCQSQPLLQFLQAHSLFNNTYNRDKIEV